jgi:1A family penicillin-binding protein
MTPSATWWRTWWGRASIAAIAVFLAAFTWAFVDLVGSVPSRAELSAFTTMRSANLLFDSADREVFTIAKEHRIEVPLDEISPHLIQAVVAIEDRRFYEHDGFDPIRIAGSALAVARAGEAVQGGSTITQQLARQAVGREKTLRRKLKELMFAAQLEHHFTKDQILELYLNKVYFGDGLYGAEAASRGYFGKRASELSVPEAAMLAGLLKAPSSYAPTDRTDKAEARQGVVLWAMLDSGAITRDEYDRALETTVELFDGLRGEEPHGRYFKEEVRRELVERLGAERLAEGGLRVYTTIDLAMQKAADEAVVEGLRDIDKGLARNRRTASGEDPLQAALVAIDPATGHVRALVGGRDFLASSFNRATQARRQPGSAFKPFVYAVAIENGYGPDDWIEGLDEPVLASEEYWTPDDEHLEYGSVTLREGLRLSSNRAAVRLLTDVGLDKTVRSASAFGFGDLPVVPSIALGSGEVTLAAITSAFGAFANGGMVVRPTLIRRIEDENGEVLFSSEAVSERAIKSTTAWVMADMLRGVIDAGTGNTARQLGFRLPAAGKTGTTNDYRDAWFIGFTPSIVTGVWVGYDQPRTIRRDGYASELAVPMWTRFMKAATKGHEPQWFQRPRGVRNTMREIPATMDDAVAGDVVVVSTTNDAPTPPPAKERKRRWWSRVFGIGK